jgi:hypothetical protein
VGADLDADINVAIRDGGETQAAQGSAALTVRVDEALAELEHALPGQPPTDGSSRRPGRGRCRCMTSCSPG